MLGNKTGVEFDKAAVQELCRKIYASFPEVTLNIGGSHTKGYADAGSDIDLVVLIDDTVPVVGRPPHYAKRIKQMANLAKLNVGLKMQHVSPLFIQQKIQENNPAALQLLFHGLLIGRKDGLRRLFFRLLEENVPTPTLREEFFKALMVAVHARENTYFPQEMKEQRKRLYPQTIEEGKKRFLVNLSS